MMPKFTLFLILILWGIGPSISQGAGRENARVIRIISGDSLTIQYHNRWEEIRLVGIAALPIAYNNETYNEALKRNSTPETIIALGKQAAAFLEDLAPYGTQVWIEFGTLKRDRVGRLLGYLYLGNGKMLNLELLQAGYADLLPMPPNRKHQDRFSRAQQTAVKQKKGLWADSRSPDRRQSNGIIL